MAVSTIPLLVCLRGVVYNISVSRIQEVVRLKLCYLFAILVFSQPTKLSGSVEGYEWHGFYCYLQYLCTSGNQNRATYTPQPCHSITTTSYIREELFFLFAMYRYIISLLPTKKKRCVFAQIIYRSTDMKLFFITEKLKWSSTFFRNIWPVQCKQISW